MHWMLQVPFRSLAAGKVHHSWATSKLRHCSPGYTYAVFEPHPRTHRYGSVRTIAGSLSGLDGILLRKEWHTVVITPELIHQSIAIELNVKDVEPLAHRVPDLCERTNN